MEQTILISSIQQSTRTHRNMIEYFGAGALHVLGQSRHFEDRFFISRRSDDISVGLLLDSLNSGTLWTHHQADNPVWNSYTDCCVSGRCWRRWTRSERCQTVVLSLGSYLRKMFSCRNYFALSCRYVFLSSGNHKHRIFSTHRCFDVGIRLGSQSLNFTT